jgi:basic membrane protein A
MASIQGLDVELKSVWVGDFNDPAKARELADAMMAEEVDVIMGSLNLGMLGIFEAAKNASDDIKVTAKYTDKSEFAPDHYVTSLLYDFVGPLEDITQRIMAGETGGYYPLGFDSGVSLHSPLQNISDELASQIEQLVADVEGGKIEVIKNTDPLE